MDKAKKPFQPVGQCIYCGCSSGLSDEHVIPFGLGGKLVLPKASCSSCADITKAFEQRLLRGHWWPYRIRNRIRSRRPKEQPNTFPVTFEYPSGQVVKGEIAPDEYPFLMVWDLDPPSFLGGAVVTGTPTARIVWKRLIALNDMPHISRVAPADSPKLTVDVNFDVEDFVRFLAKIGLAYAVGTSSLAAFSEIFVRGIVLGSTDGALTYVGGVSAPAGDFSDGECHYLREHRYGDLLTVNIVLFGSDGEQMPEYQVVVGRLAQQAFLGDATGPKHASESGRIDC